MMPKPQQTITKGRVDCPDCGMRANWKQIETHDYDGYLQPGCWVSINCPNCNYYEFVYEGPNEQINSLMRIT